MFGIFDNGYKWKTGLRVYNAMAIVIASYDLLTNPSASFGTVSTDVFIHLMTWYGLSKNLSAGSDLLLSWANLIETGVILGVGVASGETTVSLVLRTADAIGHVLNAGTLSFEEDAPAVRPR